MLDYGRELCGDAAVAGRREWLVTNGLGGYAMGTVAGMLSRSYHGLLIAAMAPPGAPGLPPAARTPSTLSRNSPPWVTLFDTKLPRLPAWRGRRRRSRRPDGWNEDARASDDGSLPSV